MNHYLGMRDPKGEAVVKLNGRPFDPARSQQVRNHSPGGFEGVTGVLARLNWPWPSSSRRWMRKPPWGFTRTSNGSSSPTWKANG